MKENKQCKVFKLIIPLLVSTVIFTSFAPTAFASDKEKMENDNTTQIQNGEDGSIIDSDYSKESEELEVNMEVDDDLIVQKYDGLARAKVVKWGKWSYTHIAVSTGVAAGAINTLFYMGLGGSVGMFGIPGWAIGGLLTGAQWTKLGSKPGKAVARKWDKNKNGWIGFYKRWGYDGAGRRVASSYTTK